MDEMYLTQKGHQKLFEELEYLKTARRRELSKEIRKAREHGDISENAEYDAAKEAQGLNEKRISELEEKLASCRILDDKNMSSDEVLIGATVLYAFSVMSKKIHRWDGLMYLLIYALFVAKLLNVF